jgi:O-antigen ligase
MWKTNNYLTLHNVNWSSYVFKIILAGILSASLGFVLVNFSAKVLAMVFSFFISLVFFIKPKNFLLGYLIISPILEQLIPYFGFDISGLRLGPQIVIRGGLTVLLMFYLIANYKDISSIQIIKPIFAILALFSITTIIVDMRNSMAFSELAKIFYWLLLLVTIAKMTQNSQMTINKIYQSVTISSIMFLIILFVSQKLGMPRKSFAPHAVAISLCMILNVIVYFIGKQKRPLYLLLAIIICILIVVSISNTYVRTAYSTSALALISLIVLTWIYSKGEEAKRQKLILTVMTLMIIVTVILQVSIHREDFNKRFADLSNLDEKTGSGRLEIWKSSYKTYLNYTIFEKFLGGGMVITYKNQFLGTGEFATHNDYLFILLSGGLLGIALFVWLFIVIVRCLMFSKNDDTTPMIIGWTTVVTYLVASMTNNVQGYPLVMTYFAFLVGGGIGHYQRYKYQTLEE